MELHDLSAGGGVLDQVGDAARAALDRYAVSRAATVTLINVSENATFLVDDSGTGSGRSCGCTGSATTRRRRSTRSWPG
ncbi:hypothetical protein [Nonomuraea recticatena]|uniref:hypothetical protein n=1 Tax=Nonomuraea recticatena TaxID=46178 RepID=UPI00361BA718